MGHVVIESGGNSSRRGALRRGLVTLLVVGLGLFSGLPVFANGSGGTNGPSAGWVYGYWDHQGGNGERDVNVCSYAVGPGVAHCNAQTRQDAGTRALASAPSQPPGSAWNASDNNVPTSVCATGTGAYDPCYPQSPYNVAVTAAAHGGGAGQIVAIVDASRNPNVTSVLAA